jgi:hypothetical protein
VIDAAEQTIFLIVVLIVWDDRDPPTPCSDGRRWVTESRVLNLPGVSP